MILCRVGAAPAALEAPLLVRELAKAGCRVQVQLDRKARLFVGPSAFARYASVVEVPTQPPEAVVFFPAATETLAALAHGLEGFERSQNVPLYVAPDLDAPTAENPAVRENLRTLEKDGFRVVFGAGEVAAAVLNGMGGPLSGKKVVVTAGGTREAIDSVRFIGNRSSGKMGLAVAREASRLGAGVTVVAANIPEKEPGVGWVAVEGVEEMRREVLGKVRQADLLVMAAAVSDFTPAEKVPEKIRRGGRERLALELRATPDVLGEVRKKNPDLFVVGFAATHGDPVPDAREKLLKKGADVIVGNDISREGVGFGTDENEVWIVSESGEKHVPKASKTEVARAILEVVVGKLRNGRQGD